MFERKLYDTLGKKTKAILREFTGRKRMTDTQYYTAVDEYNKEVDRLNAIAKREKKTLGVLPGYVEQDQEELKKQRKQYQMDKTKYITNWELTYKFYFKSDKNQKKPETKTEEHNTISSKSQIKNKVKNDYLLRMEYLYQLSPINVISSSYKIKNSIEMKKGKGLENIKMKNAYSFGLSNEEEQKWDTKTGKCVFDYLIYLYGETKGFKKIMNYETLNDIFRANEECNPLEDGVSIEQIETFCRRFNISYYALDVYEKTIKYYIPEKKCIVSSLIFRLINEHLYPIEDHKKRQSIVNKHRKNVNIKSIEVDNIKSEKEKPVYELIYPDNEEVISNNFAFDYISKLNKLPYPIKQSNLYVEDGNIKRMIIDNKLILTEPINDDVKKFYENTDRIYQGECLQNILYELWQSTYNEEIYKGQLMSSYSPIVNSLLCQSNIKYRTHFGATREITENMKELFLNEGAISCDIEKCYSSLLLNPFDEFMILDSYNDMEKFENSDYYYDDSSLPIGLYVVETDDLTILHQSNVYSNKILDYAKSKGIEFKIKYQILSTQSVSNDYFHKIYDNVKDLTDNKQLIKLVMNTITGCLGKTHSSRLDVGLTTNLEEAWENNIIKDIVNDEKIYFRTLENNDKKLYLFGKEERTKFVSNSLPIYIQILDWSNIKLHQMIEEIGGECIYRKTDCAVCIGGNQVIEMKKDELDMTITWGSFRNEDSGDEAVYGRNYNVPMKRNRHIEIPDLDNEWIIASQFHTSNQWKEILDYAIEHKGLFIDGRAGTGKSHIIHKGVENKILNEDSKYRLSFTNKASRNINGTTIHKALAINSENKSNIKSISLKYSGNDIIVIDEIGMIPLHLWKKLLVLKQSNPNLIFILLGDKRQTRPIEDLNIDYFNSTIVKHLVNFNKCELTERQRYNEELWDFLEDYYENDIVGELKHKKHISVNDIKNSKMICYFNSTRDRVNDNCMSMMRPSNYIYLPYERKVDEDGKPLKSEKAKSAYIYAGLPVMCIHNNNTLDIINTDEFEVVSFDEQTITMKNIDTENELTIEHNEFHKNFVVNYIATTHKLQGATITKNLLIFDWYAEMMCGYEYGLCLKNDKNVGYTALSRVKSLEQIYIIQ